MEDSLSVGDLVCLYSEESYGYVFSSQSSSVHSDIAVGSRQDRFRPNIQEQQVLTFEIQVSNNFKLNEEYSRLLVQQENDPDNIILRNSVSKARVAADAENNDNEILQKRSQGKKVLYGQTIQLRHVFTNKYIHISTTNTSVIEGNNMAVELLEENAIHAQFKVMPRYKVKAEGDIVQIDDQVVLESIRSPGSFLHVSKSLLGKEAVYSDCHELNLSVQPSGFTVYRKYKPSNNDSDFVKAGDIVRFFHKEMEAYMVAEGLFNEDLMEDVHLRIRPVDQRNPKSMLPSTSALTYWQIEFEEGPIEGGIMRWEQQCKLIHMCSRKYLVVESGGGVNLTNDHDDPRSVFRLHPVIREQDAIPTESYCRIQHVVTRRWLHALNEDYDRKRAVKTEDSSSIASLSWSTAVLKKIGTSVEKQYDDAFTIQAVDEELKIIFNYMSGMVPFVQKLVADKRQGLTLNAKMANDVVTALSEIKDFMFQNSVPVKKRQKLLRHLKIVDLMVSLLQIQFRGASDKEHLKEIFIEAYDVLAIYLSGFSRKNELYMARYIDFFLSQFEYNEGLIGLNAVHMVMELLRDNRKIKDRITRAHIDKFIELLHRDQNYRYLDLLSVLCVCDGVTNVDNQKYITDAWLKSQNKQCVYFTSFGQSIGKKEGILYVSTNHKRTWRELTEFAADDETDEYMFLQQQLELFGELCRGQNSYSIGVITKELKFLSWEEAFTCLCDERLPAKLRAQFCHLIITMFIAIDENHSVIDRVKLSYVFEDIGHLEEMMDKSKSETYQIFPEVSAWIAEYLGKNSNMVASEVGTNMLTRQVLILVQNLVSFGFYYKSEDLRALLAPLMSLIDGRNDQPYPKLPPGKEGDEMLKRFQTIERFEQSVETTAITDAKYQAMETLDLFLNLRYNFRMEKFMMTFKDTYVDANKPNVTYVEFGPLLLTEFDVREHSTTARSALKKLKDIFEQTAFMKEFGIVEVLKDLSRYDYDNMIRMSMHLLNRYYSAHAKLFERAMLAQVIITDKSTEVCSTLDRCMPTVRRYASSELNDDRAKDLCTVMDEIIKMCHLEGEVQEPHQMNQNILYNYGILRDMFSILSQKVDLGLVFSKAGGVNREKYVGLQKVFEKTFILMKMLAKGNAMVQERLFRRIDLIMAKNGAYKEMALCLTEIFTGNTSICIKIKDETIRKIMVLISRHKTEVPQYVDVLNALIKIEEIDVPLRRNQSIVMKYFMEFRSDVAHVLDQEDSARKAVLTTPGHKDLPYMIAMVDMLATCAEGERRFIESICQTIFKISDLLEILSNPSVSHNIKRPFVRFFMWVYLRTAGGMIESGAGDLPHDPAMWAYLKVLGESIKKVSAYTKENTHEVKQLLKRPPARGSSIARYGCFIERYSESINSVTEQMRASVHYLFDGVMPFLQTFCRQYYRPSPESYPDEPKQIDALTDTFWEFLELMAPIIRNEKQMKSILGCMTTMLATCTLNKSRMNEFHDKYGQGTRDFDFKTDARKAYMDYYQTEEEINQQLRVFGKNMMACYEDLHTLEAKSSLSGDLDYSDLGADERLPLGPEFQEHLRCFIDPSKDSPEEKYALADKLVKQLSISGGLSNLSEKEKIERIDLDVKCLQLLRGLIHNEIVKLPKDWERDASKHRQQLKRISDVQDALDYYGVVVSVQEHINRPNEEVVRETLAFMASLFFNGNENAQLSLITYFQGTREETFFHAIKFRLQVAAQAAADRNLLAAMHQAKLDDALLQAKALKKALQTQGAGVAAVSDSKQRLGSKMSVLGSSRHLKPMDGRLHAGGIRGNMGSGMMGSRQNMGSGMMGKMDGKHHMGSGMMGRKDGRQQMGSGIFRMDGKQMGSGGAIRPDTKQMGSGAIRTVANNVPKSDSKDVMKNGSAHRLKMNSGKVVPVNIEIEGPKPDNVDEEEAHEEDVENATIGSLEFKDDSFIELVLRILGLMCDNQCSDVQNYLREQPDNIKSMNLVAESTQYMSILYSNISDKSMPLAIQMFHTLVEFCSGNHGNQAVVVDNKICDYINFILRIENFHGCTLEQVYVLKKAIATLIKILTEENIPEVDEEKRTEKAKPSLGMQVMETLDTDVCVTTMTTAYEQLKSKDPKLMEIQDLVTDTGFSFFHILSRKMDLKHALKPEDFITTDESLEAWQFFKGNTLSIEIVKDDALQKIYFRVKDKKVLREDVKDLFKYEVDRTSPSNKIRDFMDWASDIIQDIKYQRKVHNNLLGRMLVKIWKPLNYAVLALSVLICLFITVVWKDPKVPGTTTSDINSYVPEFSIDNYMTIIYIVGGLHNFLSFCILVTYFLLNRPSFPPYNYLKRKLMSHNEDEDAYKNWHELKDDSHLDVQIYSIRTLYYVVFLVFSILGTIFYGYFFAFHLLHIALLNQLLQRVIQAVTTNGRSLLMVGLLGLVLFFCYSLVAFAFFRESFLSETNGRHCRTVGQCLVTMIHHGFVDSPYTSFEGQMTVDYQDVVKITIFDVTFFILVTTIGLNIIFGIIVDTFSELRDSKWEIDKDMQNNCFICSRESYEFERHGDGFEKHVKEEHNQWAYLFFFIHLDETRPNDYTALELYVFNKLHEHSHDFFPLNQALCLLDEEDGNELKLENMRSQLDFILTKMKEEEAAKEREKERQKQEEWEKEHRQARLKSAKR